MVAEFEIVRRQSSRRLGLLSVGVVRSVWTVLSCLKLNGFSHPHFPEEANMKNLTAYQIARIRLAKMNAKKLSEQRSQTAAVDQPSNAAEPDIPKESWQRREGDMGVG